MCTNNQTNNPRSIDKLVDDLTNLMNTDFKPLIGSLSALSGNLEDLDLSDP